MDKKTIMLEFFRSKIIDLVERVQDVSLLDYIYRLLIKELNV